MEGMGITAARPVRQRPPRPRDPPCRGRVGIVRAQSWYRAIERGQLEQVHPGVCRMFGARADTGAGDPRRRARRRAAARWRRTARRPWLWGMPRPDRRAGRRDPAAARRAGDASPAPSSTGPATSSTSRRPARPASATTNILRTLCDLGAARPGRGARRRRPRRDDGARPPRRRCAGGDPPARAAGRPGVPALRDALGDWVLDGKPVDSVLEPAMRAAAAAARPAAGRVPPVHRRLRGRLPRHRQPARPRVRRLDHARARPVRQFERDRDAGCGPRRPRLRRAAVHLPGDHHAARRRRPNGSAATSCAGRPTSSPAADLGARPADGFPPRWRPVAEIPPRSSGGLREEALEGGAGGAGDVEASRRRGWRRRRRRRASPGRRPRDGVGGEHLVAAEGDGGAGDVGDGDARGDGAVHATTTSNSSARSASSIAVGSRSVPTTRMRRPSGLKSSKNTWAHVSAPGGLWAPSTTTSGW